MLSAEVASLADATRRRVVLAYGPQMRQDQPMSFVSATARFVADSGGTHARALSNNLNRKNNANLQQAGD